MNETDYQYQTAAQVIDQRTAVGLARTPQVDLRFFRRPPALPDLEDVCIKHCNLHIHTYLPHNISHVCNHGNIYRYPCERNVESLRINTFGIAIAYSHTEILDKSNFLI